MVMYFLFQPRKESINRVRGVWYVELWVLQVGKQKGQITLKCFVGTTHFFVRVVPMLRAEHIGLLGYVRVPLFLPCSECFRKLILSRCGEC